MYAYTYGNIYASTYHNPPGINQRPTSFLEVSLPDRSPAAPHTPQQHLGPRGYNGTVAWRERITFDPQVMGGRPCIRGMRITVGTILTLLRHQTPEEILRDYPYLEREDIDAALEYAAYLADEREVAV